MRTDVKLVVIGELTLAKVNGCLVRNGVFDGSVQLLTLALTVAVGSLNLISALLILASVNGYSNLLYMMSNTLKSIS